MRPVSPPKPLEARTPVPKTPPPENDMNDDIPVLDVLPSGSGASCSRPHRSIRLSNKDRQ